MQLSSFILKVSKIFISVFAESKVDFILRTIAFASRRLSRNSRVVLDLAQVTLPKKFEDEGNYVEKYGVPGVGDQIMVKFNAL